MSIIKACTSTTCIGDNSIPLSSEEVEALACFLGRCFIIVGPVQIVDDIYAEEFEALDYIL